MAGHDPKERRLLTDISDKNRLANEFRILSSDVRNWRDRLEQKRGKRAQARYRGAIERASERMESLRSELLERAEDLESRIKTEQKVSKAEIDKFHKQYAKEVQELSLAQAQLAEARKDLAKADAESRAHPEGSEEAERSGAVLAEFRRRHWKANEEAKRETRDVAKAKQEISSEERDKALLSGELERAIAEVESLRDPSA
jgi:hypothetical protein